MAQVKLSGFVEAFAGMSTALKEARKAALPAYRDAVDDWATETSKRSVVNLNRPKWLLSQKMGRVVKDYHGKLWALSGITREGKTHSDPGQYVKFHETGWRANGGKPSAPVGFMKRAKRETTPQLLRSIEKANQKIQETFKTTLARETSKRLQG